MNFRDLSEAIQRLANDPRVHPTTRIEVEQEHRDTPGTYRTVGSVDVTDHWREQEPLVSISIRDRVLVLSSERSEPAVVR